MDQILSTTGGITPPQELVQQWQKAPEFSALSPCVMVTVTNTKLQDIATQAAQWGADQELEACCQWLHCHAVTEFAPGDLRAARRPKPQSLKEQALEELNKVDMLWDTTEFSQETLNSLDTIRRALEQLDD